MNELEKKIEQDDRENYMRFKKGLWDEGASRFSSFREKPYVSTWKCFFGHNPVSLKNVYVCSGCGLVFTRERLETGGYIDVNDPSQFKA